MGTAPQMKCPCILTLIMVLVGSQIILSQILAIQNNNHTQKHKYLREKPFGKNHGTNSE